MLVTWMDRRISFLMALIELQTEQLAFCAWYAHFQVFSFPNVDFVGKKSHIDEDNVLKAPYMDLGILHHLS